MTYDRQQLLWQKQVTIIGSINLGSDMNEYRTGVALFQNAISHCRSLRRQRFAPMSLFFVAPDAYSQSFSEFFSVANLNSFFIDETNKGNIIQQLFWAEESSMAICFNQMSRRRLFKHFKPRSRWQNDLYDPRPCYLMCLNNKFVGGLIGLVPAHLPRSHSLHYAHASSAVDVLSVVAIFVN